MCLAKMLGHSVCMGLVLGVCCQILPQWAVNLGQAHLAEGLRLNNGKGALLVATGVDCVLGGMQKVEGPFGVGCMGIELHHRTPLICQ